MKDAVKVKTDDGFEFASVRNIGGNLAEASLKSVTEVLQETVGKEYGIDFSYTNKYNEGKLMIDGYDYQEGYIRDSISEVLEKSECER